LVPGNNNKKISPIIRFKGPLLEWRALISDMRTIIDGNRDNFEKNIRIMESEAEVELSKQYINSARSEHLPSVNLNAQYSKIEADSAVSSLENSKSITIQLQVPIYTGGATSSKVTASKLSLSSVKRDYHR